MVKHREGGDPSTTRKSPGRTEYDAITLERGVTHDTAFEDWANKVWNLRAGPRIRGVARRTSARTSSSTSSTRPGRRSISYKIYRCWVSEYQAVPDFDANANAVAIQHLKLENEGWERDLSVTEPTEPTLTIPV